MAYSPASVKASELAPGGMRLAMVEGTFVLLSNVGGVIYATSHLCPHAGAALNYGRLYDNEAECPLHGAVFDVTDGGVVNGPAPFGLECYPVKLEGDVVLVDMG